MLMPGMLTEEQMKQLDAARGTEFDRLFLTFMIQHHQGAVVDGGRRCSTRTAPAQDEIVFKFASDVHVDQTHRDRAHGEDARRAHARRSARPE